jgi:soluble cytochrome b562
MKVDYKNKKVLSEEAVENSQVEYAVESTKLELQSALLATKKSLAEAKSALEDLKSNYPINIEAIVEKQLEVRDYTNGIEIIESLQKEYGFK